MAVRSVWLGGGSFADADTHTLFTCADGVTILVKNVLIYTQTSPSPAFTMSHVLAGGAELPIFALPSGEAPTGIVYGGVMWEVLEPGDSVTWTGDGSGTWTVTVSGAELAGVA